MSVLVCVMDLADRQVNAPELPVLGGKNGKWWKMVKSSARCHAFLKTWRWNGAWKIQQQKFFICFLFKNVFIYFFSRNIVNVSLGVWWFAKLSHFFNIRVLFAKIKALSVNLAILPDRNNGAQNDIIFFIGHRHRQ